MEASVRSSLFAVALFAASAGCSSGPPSAGPPGGEPVGVEQADLASSDLDFPVTLQGTGSATIHASVYANPALRVGATILAVHGLVETGFDYGPLAQAIFKEPRLGREVLRVVAIDLPGHGDSSLPAGLPGGRKFGDLTIDDNVSVVLQSIEALRRRRLAPQVIVGHSMGGLEVQATQQALLSRGSSLAREGISAAILLAPVPPHGRPWAFPESPNGGLLTQFVIPNDPVLGTYFALPPAVFESLLFTNLSGTPVPGAPTVAEITSNKDLGPEPITTLLQLVEAPIPSPDGGTITLPRPSVEAGAFAAWRGTRLTMVSFSQDVFLQPSELKDLYEYLTGDTRDRRYVAITQSDAVHEMFLSNPTAILDAILPTL
jgi:pimeloyl-ACP methyl ester carboxylesterase